MISFSRDPPVLMPVVLVAERQLHPLTSSRTKLMTCGQMEKHLWFFSLDLVQALHPVQR